MAEWCNTCRRAISAADDVGRCTREIGGCPLREKWDVPEPKRLNDGGDPPAFFAKDARKSTAQLYEELEKR